ncbi:MAG TPA: DoxX family protein [Polyangia bacterium]|nr:DoxX family protein [Polyangia bacterium]
MNDRLHRILASRAPRAVWLIRLAVAMVFVSEGIQKFLYPAALGAGRFAKIGIPAPALMGPFIGVVEIACGALILVGLFTRLAGLLLLADMTVAILSTKIPILIGHGYWGFAAPSGKSGLWSMLHEARTDLSMWLACLFLLIVGAGGRSVDARLAPADGS